ncbi:MAG: DUF1573 domain-containing protein [Bacteroidales bacterium]|jgi:hypothetical protein|nr:DUF1573 domain-containing protein [Bacteroidales bacterium]
MKNIFTTLLVLLMAGHIVNGQAKIEFEKTTHDFGKINEKGDKASHDFIFKNTGTTPLLVQNVRTNCGCTASDWTKEPVNPGKSGFVRITYDIEGRPGKIDKSAYVITNAKPAQITLRLLGEVIPIERKPPETFRYPAGPLKLSDMHVALNKMYAWETKTAETFVLNPGSTPVKISFERLPAYIQASATPSTVKGGEKAKISITYSSPKKKDWGFISEQISMILNDDPSKEYKLTVTANVEEDFSQWKPAEIMNAPTLSLDTKIIEAGKIARNSQSEHTIKITNQGKSKLFIRKISSNSPQVKIQSPSEINSGKSADITVTYNATDKAGTVNDVITLICNDPGNSVSTIRLRASIE